MVLDCCLSTWWVGVLLDSVWQLQLITLRYVCHALLSTHSTDSQTAPYQLRARGIDKPFDIDAAVSHRLQDSGIRFGCVEPSCLMVSDPGYGHSDVVSCSHCSGAFWGHNAFQLCWRCCEQLCIAPAGGGELLSLIQITGFQ